MSLDKVTLAELVAKAFRDEHLSAKEIKKMLGSLWRKYWEEGLDSFREQIVLTSFIYHRNSREARAIYRQEVLERLGLIRKD